MGKIPVAPIPSVGSGHIATGGYIGNGGKITLTFDFEPKLVVIGSSWPNGSYERYLMIGGCPRTSRLGAGSSLSDFSLTWSGNTVSWNGAEANADGIQHYFIAIG